MHHHEARDRCGVIRLPCGPLAATIGIALLISGVAGGAMSAQGARPADSTPMVPAVSATPNLLHPATAVLEPSPPSADPRIGVPLDAESAAWVERTLAALTLRQRVAQLVMPWVPGQRSAPSSAEFQRMLRWVERDEVGGLIISRGPPDAIAARLNAAQSRAKVPLLVTSDLESGPAMRLSPGGTYFPPAMAFSAAGDAALAREAGRITGVEARSVGIHMTLGPLLDVNSNPANPIINVRSYGEDPIVVGTMATAWAAGARETGLLAAGKHFPGHGETALDSHVGLPTLFLDSARMEAVELAPFRRAIDLGIDAILVGHIAVAGIDGPNAPPASLSTRMVDELLRTRLGFHGLIITDALNMGAITRNYSVGEASIRAILAGADILLQPPGAPQVIESIVAAVESGRIPPERIEAAARRVLTAKAAAGLHRGTSARVNPAAVRAQVGSGGHREVARRVTEASITLVRDQADLVPLAKGNRRILHLVHTGPGSATLGSTLSEGLRSGGYSVEQVRVTDRMNATETRALSQKAAAADIVIATAYVAPRENRPLTVGTTFAGLVDRLASDGRPVIAVSLGSPYILNSFPSVSSYLLAWSASEGAQRAAARALLGTAPVTGRLPVSIAPHHQIGEGLSR